MEIEEYIDSVQSEGHRLVTAAASAGLTARVPSCPDWDVRELVRHIGGVHHWAAEQVEGRHTDEISGDLVDIVGSWPTDTELLLWATGCVDRLVRVFREADPSFPYFTWMPGATPLTMWTRRQAHETAIHRVDAELAAGALSPFAAEFACDGIDELVMAMIGQWKRALPVPESMVLQISPSDSSQRWTVVLTPDGFETHANQRGTADAELTGPADSLYRALWSRGDDGSELQGDVNVLDAWHASVNPTWS